MFGLHRFFRHCCYLGRFSRIDFSFESRTVLNEDTCAENIAFDIGALGQRHNPVTSDFSVNLPYESRAVLNEDTCAENIAFDIGTLGQRHNPVASDFADNLSQNSDGAGMDLSLDSALFAHREMLLVKRNNALDVTIND